MNTLIQTNGGELFLFGGGQYGQHGKTVRQRDEELKEFRAKEAAERLKMQCDNEPLLVRFPDAANVKVNTIACGGEHIIVITNAYEAFSWGRNDSGQLGLGFISEMVGSPTRVDSLGQKNLKFAAAGENYSGVLSAFGEVLVTGSLEFGKCGLGEAAFKGY